MGNLSRLSFNFTCLVWLLSVSLCLRAAPTLQDYGELPSVSMFDISPSGDLVAFRNQNQGRDLVVVRSLTSGELVQALEIGATRPRSIYFFDDRRLVIIGSQHRRVLGFKGSFDVSTAFLLDLDTGNIVQMLTPGDVIYAGQTGLGSILGVSEDGNHVYMPAFVSRSEGQNPAYSLLRVSLDNPRGPFVVARGSPNTIDYFVNADGRLLAEEVFDNRRNRHIIYSFLEGKREQIYREDTEIRSISIVGLTPDRQSLVVLGLAEESGRRSYFTMSLADGAISNTDFGRSDADIAGVIQDINRIVYGVRYAGLRASYRFFDPALDARMSKILSAFPKHYVSLLSWTSGFENVVVGVSGVDTAGDIILFSKDNKGRLIAQTHPNIQAEFVHPVIEFEYKSRDGLTIPALITVPKSRAESLSKLPAIMMPHGGPAAHDTIGFNWKAQALANRGYAVIQPQFRGSWGFGRAHEAAGEGEWGKKMQDDLTDGLNILVKEELVDPDRVCIVGSSYGGYAALAGGAFTPELYRCVVSINGVSDLRGMLAADRTKLGRNHWVLAYLERVMVDGDASRRNLDAVSPSQYAKDFQAPVLLIHGRNDSVVPVSQSKLMERQLKRAKKPVKLVELRGEDHNLSRSETRLRALEEIVGFVDQHIGVSAKH